jgi:flagellar FliL protein
MVEVRDAIILVISSRNSEELLKPEGKEKLKRDIRETLNGLLSSGEVEEIYFVDFVMQ